MSEPFNGPTISAALAATGNIRRARGFQALGGDERAALERDLGRIERALIGSPQATPAETADPFAVPLETPFDRGAPTGGPPLARPGGAYMTPGPAAPPPAAPPRAPTATELLGGRARQVIAAVDFP